MSLVMIIVLVGVVFAGAYYLFFAPTPGIEVIIPTDQKIAQDLSAVTVRPEEVNQNATYQSLRQITTTASPGQVGRSNPFLKF